MAPFGGSRSSRQLAAGVGDYAGPICIIVFALTLMTTGIVSLGSMLAATALPILLFIFEGINPDAQISLTLRVFALLIPVFIGLLGKNGVGKTGNPSG